jgi:hypothetical protein
MMTNRLGHVWAKAPVNSDLKNQGHNLGFATGQAIVLLSFTMEDRKYTGPALCVYDGAFIIQPEAAQWDMPCAPQHFQSHSLWPLGIVSAEWLANIGQGRTHIRRTDSDQAMP